MATATEERTELAKGSGEAVVGGKGEAVAGGEGSSVDQALGLRSDAAGALHGEGEEVRGLRRRYLRVLGHLLLRGVGGHGEVHSG